MEKGFIFDLDDTLIYTQKDYNYSIIEFQLLMQEAIFPDPPNPTELTSLQEKTDINLAEKMGFKKQRFPSSIVLTYRKLCEEKGIKPRREIEKKCYSIGMKTFDLKHSSLVSGAHDVLRFLKAEENPLYLITRGDKCVQNAKIDKFGLKKYFDKIYTTEKDDKKRIAEKITNGAPSLFYWVGDSKRSDVLPALESRINSIHIPVTTWFYDNHDSKIEFNENTAPKYIKLDKLKDIKRLYHKL